MEGKDSSIRFWSRTLDELARGASRLLKSELRLAQAELLSNARRAGRRSALAAACAVLAALGLLSLLAAAIFALGSRLDGRYDLSSLIVGAALFAAGAVPAYFLSSQAGRKTGLPEFRRSLEDDRKLLAGRFNRRPEIPEKRVS